MGFNSGFKGLIKRERSKGSAAAGKGRYIYYYLKEKKIMYFCAGSEEVPSRPSGKGALEAR
jgi:hypothetical protein